MSDVTQEVCWGPSVERMGTLVALIPIRGEWWCQAIFSGRVIFLVNCNKEQASDVIIIMLLPNSQCSQILRGPSSQT